MNFLIKYNEFFDTEEFKISHDIEILTNELNPSKIIKNFNTQEPYIPLLNMLSFKFPFLLEVSHSNEYANLKSINDTYYITFKNENATISLGIKIHYNKLYDLSIIYVPNGVNPNKNKIVTYNKLLDIYNDTTVYQIFKNISFMDICKNIDDIFIPVMKYFRFDNLLKIRISQYNIRSN